MAKAGKKEKLSTYGLMGKSHAGEATPVVLVTPDTFKALLAAETKFAQAWVQGNGFKGTPGTSVVIPNSRGGVKKIYAAIGNLDDLYSYAALPAKLPAGNYKIENSLTNDQANKAALAWAMASYQYDETTSAKHKVSKFLTLSPNADKAKVLREASATFMIRDLVNIPANEMGPKRLEKEACKLASKFNAKAKVTKGDDLLKDNYPLIHTVGRANAEEPRLVDFCWGDPKHPKVTLVGKGVTFDTGGNNVKPASSMRDMKKDMGGAAHVLGLAKMIMEANLPVRLRVLIPIAENSIAGNAFRPGDVLKSRKGITIENDNTDAEGRLILADALTEAASEKPELLIDFATLTGAQRVAHGLEIGGVMGTNKALERELEDTGEEIGDYLARLPLHQRYKSALSSPFADCKSSGGQAGSITAGLFLQQFTDGAKDWLHFDVSAWNPSPKAGRPYGGEALGARAVMSTLEKRFKP